MSFKPTNRQILANQLLAGDATHTMLYGGSRSGKTFIIVRAILMRALKQEKSRHACLRFRFNHIVSSIVMDTMPKVVDICFPGLAELSKLDKQLWVYKLPNGSEIWFGGLDDKERTEKILGQEYSTIYLNECSQIAYGARNIALTRLAQNVGLKRRFLYDCNPPVDSHWTNKLFIKKVDPDNGKPLPNGEEYVSMLMNPKDNLENLDPAYLRDLENMPEKLRKRFLLGEFSSAVEGALWNGETIDKFRLEQQPDKITRIVISVDPSGCQGEEDKRSDEIGIIVAGLTASGYAVVLEDLSGRHGPAEWGRIVVDAFDRHEADCIVGEENFGGAMVKEIIRSQRSGVPYKAVRASRAKHVRAEPVAALYDDGKVRHVGHFAKLEDQLLGFTTAGYQGDRSPDRADALVWAIMELFPSLTKGEAPKVDLQQFMRPRLSGAQSWMAR
jgi:phage terminase large subunit-like protein